MAGEKLPSVYRSFKALQPLITCCINPRRAWRIGLCNSNQTISLRLLPSATGSKDLHKISVPASAELREGLGQLWIAKQLMGNNCADVDVVMFRISSTGGPVGVKFWPATKTFLQVPCSSEQY